MSRFAETLIAVVGATLLIAPTAFAGGSHTPGVVITDSVAYGTTTGARDSADGYQFIGCGITGYSTGVSGFCQARDATSRHVYCSTANATHLQVIGAKSDFARIYFSWDSQGRCVTLQSIGRSDHMP